METVCRKIGEKFLNFLKILDRAESKGGDFAAGKFRLSLWPRLDTQRKFPARAYLRIIAP